MCSCGDLLGFDPGSLSTALESDYAFLDVACAYFAFGQNLRQHQMRIPASGEIGVAIDAQTLPKLCMASRRSWHHNSSVRSRLSALIRVNRPRIKAEWHRRLRIAPVGTPL